MCESINDVPKKKGILEKIGLIKEEEPLTCERCAYETINGADSFKTLPERIKEKQDRLQSLIKSKFVIFNQGGEVMKKPEFNCVITLEEDIAMHAQEVFQPFIDGGFEIINISKACEDIFEDNVFFISWRRAFKNVDKVVKL